MGGKQSQLKKLGIKPQTPIGRAQFKLIYERIDKERKGLTKEQAHKFLNMLAVQAGITYNATTAEQIINTCDADGNGRLNYSEFQRAFYSASAMVLYRRVMLSRSLVVEINDNAATTSVWAVPLDVSVERSDPKRCVPSPLRDSIIWLNKHGLKEPGLYRVPGDQTRFSKYKELYLQGKRVDFEAEGERQPQNVAMVVVKYLTTLPENIFTHDLAPSFVSTQKLDSESNRHLKLRELADKLPLANRETLRFFTDHLRLVIANQEDNKMTELATKKTFQIMLGAVANVIMEIVKEPTILTKTCLFGLPVDEAALLSDSYPIPRPVKECVDFLQIYSGRMTAYTKIAPKKHVLDLEYLFNCNETIPMNVSRIDVAGLLKKYLKDLPEPLIIIPDDIASVLSVGNMKSKAIATVKKFLNGLNEVNRETVAYIIHHLSDISKKSTMPISQLALIFPWARSVIPAFIKHADVLFEKIELFKASPRFLQKTLRTSLVSSYTSAEDYSDESDSDFESFVRDCGYSDETPSTTDEEEAGSLRTPLVLSESFHPSFLEDSGAKDQD